MTYQSVEGRGGSRANRSILGALVLPFLLSILVLPPPARAPLGDAGNQDQTESPPVFRVDSTHSLLGFEVTHLGFTTVRGTFRNWNGAIAYDPEEPARSSVTIFIDVGSIDTGNDTRDDDLRSANFFDAERHPLAFFQSTRVEPTGDGFEARGMLSIRGTTREVVIPVRHLGQLDRESSERIGFAGELTIARADFGVVNEGNILETTGVIGKEVTLEFEVAAFRRRWAATPFSQYSSLPSAGEAFLERLEEDGPDQALDWARTVIEDPPDDLRTATGEFLIAASRQVDDGDPGTATRLLELVARLRPDDTDVRLLLGDTLRVAGDRDGAEAVYRRILSTDAVLPDAVAVEALRQLTGVTSRITVSEFVSS